MNTLTRDDLNRAQAIAENAYRLMGTHYAKQLFLEASTEGQIAPRGTKNPYPDSHMLNAVWAQGQLVARLQTDVARMRAERIADPVAVEAADE